MYIPCMPLSSVQAGESAELSSLHLSEALRERLLSIGMIPGTKVRCLYRREGSLAAYEVRGAVVAIRLCDARFVMVKKCRRCK